MRKVIHKNALRALTLQRNYACFAGIGLLVLCLIQGIALVKKETKIIGIPPQMNERFWVTNQTVSDNYLSRWTSFFVGLRLNKTPSNAAHQSEKLLGYTAPEFYGALKEQLKKEDEKIRKGTISTYFSIVSAQIFQAPLRVIVTGDFHAEVGKSRLPTRRLQYVITYDYTAGKVHIVSFKQRKESLNETKKN